MTTINANELEGLTWSYSLCLSFGCISISYTLLTMIITLIFRDRASFVFSQPSFLGVLLLGVLLVQLSLCFLAFSIKDAALYSAASQSCTAYLWLYWCGSSLALSAQVARLYRALLVFRERTLRRPKTNTSMFLLSVLALCSVPLGLMSVRMAIDPVRLENGVCRPLEVARNANSIVLGLMVRLSVWLLLFVCYSLTRVLNKLGATVDDAKTQTKLFLWIFLLDGIVTILQSLGLPTDDVGVLLSFGIAFGTVVALHSVFRPKITRLGLNGKEMLVTLRVEKETREMARGAWKRRSSCPTCFLSCGRCFRKLWDKITNAFGVVMKIDKENYVPNQPSPHGGPYSSEQQGNTQMSQARFPSSQQQQGPVQSRTNTRLSNRLSSRVPPQHFSLFESVQGATWFDEAEESENMDSVPDVVVASMGASTRRILLPGMNSAGSMVGNAGYVSSHRNRDSSRVENSIVAVAPYLSTELNPIVLRESGAAQTMLSPTTANVMNPTLISTNVSPRANDGNANDVILASLN